MDISTLIGIIIGFAALVGGFLWDGGQISGLMQITAAVIVFGGTIAAIIISFPTNRLKLIPHAIKIAFTSPKEDIHEIIDEISAMSSVARREGVLALEKRTLNSKHQFLSEGIQLVVDGTEQGVLKQILEYEMDATEKKYESYAKIFEAAGGYAPTMGIIGTVMGLIHVLVSLKDPAALGSSIALAFTATLYGVASANLIFLPIASKIKTRGEDKLNEMEMIVEGVLSIQNGEHPLLVRRKVESFVINDIKTSYPSSMSEEKDI